MSRVLGKASPHTPTRIQLVLQNRGHLVTPEPSNVGFWALQFISGPSNRPLEAHLVPGEATGELLNLQNEEEIFSFKIS